MTTFADAIATPNGAYEEGLRFFRGEGFVNEVLRRIAADLEREDIDYCVIGAVALNQHGYRRFTADIDLLLSPEGLEKFWRILVSISYQYASDGGRKKFRVLPENVPVEIITSGEYPGDGKPGPVTLRLLKMFRELVRNTGTPVDKTGVPVHIGAAAEPAVAGVR